MTMPVSNSLHRRRASRTRWGAFAVLTLVAAWNGCGPAGGQASATPEAGEERPINVRVLEIQPTTLRETLRFSGTLRAVRATDVSTEESGIVRRIPTQKGAVVRGGQILVELDRRLLEAELRAAEATRDLRVYDEERTRRLFEADSISEFEWLQVKTAAENARSAARSAALRYERAAVSAPFDGVFVERYVELGQLVVPGQRVARVVDPFRLKLVGALTEGEVRWVREGEPAWLEVDGVGEPLPAVVAYVSVEADPVNGKFAVEIEVDNPELRLRAGVVGRAELTKAVHPRVLAVPRDAIVRGNQGDTVFVVDDGHAVPHRVTLGPGQGMMVMVQEGLEAGQQVVVRGQRMLEAGTPVRVQEKATARDGSIDTDPAEVRERRSLGLWEDRTAEAQLPSGTAGGRR